MSSQSPLKESRRLGVRDHLQICRYPAVMHPQWLHTPHFRPLATYILPAQFWGILWSSIAC